MKKRRPDPRAIFARKRARFEAKHPELAARMKSTHAHAKHIEKAHGLARVDYEYLQRVQKGRCAICGKLPEEVKQKHLAVDHCHETGRTRGLLCRNCNWTLGVIKENLATAQALVDYISKRCIPAQNAG